MAAFGGCRGTRVASAELGCAPGVIAAKVRKLSLSTAHEFWGPPNVPAVCSIRELETLHSGSGSQPPPWFQCYWDVTCDPHAALPWCEAAKDDLGSHLFSLFHWGLYAWGSGVSSTGLGGRLGSALPGNQAGESLCHVWSQLLPMGCSSPSSASLKRYLLRRGAHGGDELCFVLWGGISVLVRSHLQSKGCWWEMLGAGQPSSTSRACGRD